MTYASGYTLQLFCDFEFCGNSSDYCTSTGCNSETSAKKAARKDGWLISDRGDGLCFCINHKEKS